MLKSDYKVAEKFVCKFANLLRNKILDGEIVG